MKNYFSLERPFTHSLLSKWNVNMFLKLFGVRNVIFGRANKRNRLYASGIVSRLGIEKEIGKEKARKP